MSIGTRLQSISWCHFQWLPNLDFRNRQLLKVTMKLRSIVRCYFQRLWVTPRDRNIDQRQITRKWYKTELYSKCQININRIWS